MSRYALRIGLIAVLTGLIFCGHRLLADPVQSEKPFQERLIGPQTMVFAHSRFAEVMQSPVTSAVLEQVPAIKEEMDKNFRKDMGFGITDLDTASVFLEKPKIENGVPQAPMPPYMLFQCKTALNTDAVKQAVAPGGQSKRFGKYELTFNSTRGVAFLDQKTMLHFAFDGNPDNEEMAKRLTEVFQLLDAPAALSDPMKAGIALLGEKKHHVVAVLQIPAELSAFAQEQLKEVPPTFAAFKPLAKLQSGLFSMDYVEGQENDLQLQFRGRFPNADNAKAASASVRFALGAAKMALGSLPAANDASMKEMSDFARKQLDLVKVDLSEAEVVISYQTSNKVLLPMLLAATEKVRLAADRMVSASNMRQCLIAMHNYHNDFGKLPEAVTLKNNKPMHSWRVLLLPYVDQDQLFKQIKMDEPWDSEANKKLFESVPMPKIFAHPGKRDEESSRKTYYKVFVSKSDAQPRAGFLLGKPMTLGQMTVMDGTSNTICLIEAGPPVLWYKPDDLEFDVKAQLPTMVSPWKTKQVNVTMFDGSVRQLWLDGDEATWKALITVNGGETADISKLEEKK